MSNTAALGRTASQEQLDRLLQQPRPAGFFTIQSMFTNTLPQAAKPDSATVQGPIHQTPPESLSITACWSAKAYLLKHKENHWSKYVASDNQGLASI